MRSVHREILRTWRASQRVPLARHGRAASVVFKDVHELMPSLVQVGTGAFDLVHNLAASGGGA